MIKSRTARATGGLPPILRAAFATAAPIEYLRRMAVGSALPPLVSVAAKVRRGEGNGQNPWRMYPANQRSAEDLKSMGCGQRIRLTRLFG